MSVKTESTVKPVATSSSPGVLVLQWLTYAFWGWTALALIWLTSQSVSFFIDSDADRGYQNESISYALAAVIVLFIISFVCDWIYAKREPLHKAGAAMVIMIIHAVIFALFAIGSLIAAVFAVVNLLIGSDTGGNEGPLTVLITGLIMAVVYGATLLRTLRPFKLKRVTLVYGLFMAVVSVGVTVLAIAGPALHAAQTRDDRLIERGLPQVSESIRSYAQQYNKLPASLSAVESDLTDDAKDLVDRDLVKYIPGEKRAGGLQLLQSDTTEVKPIMAPAPSESVYDYQLCVTYKAKKGSGNSTRPMPAIYREGGNEISPDTYEHPAGYVCYRLVTDYERYY